MAQCLAGLPYVQENIGSNSFLATNSVIWMIKDSAVRFFFLSNSPYPPSAASLPFEIDSESVMQY